MKPSIFLLMLAVPMLGYTGKEQRPSSKQIDAFIKSEMKNLRIPGMAVAIIKDGKVEHMGTYGMADLEWDRAVTKNTAFQIASVTKLFTSTLMMKFIQEGRINLNDKISRFFPDAPASWDEVTVSHLLSHESGIPWPKSIGGFIGTKASTTDKPATKEEVYKDMKDSALTFSPGKKESYMNGDAFVLQMLVEKIAGKNITEVFENELFRPLGMHNSGFDGEIRNFPSQVMKPVKQKSQIYTKGRTGHLIYKSFYNPTSYCSGGLYTSIEDAAKWAVALDKGEFIQPATVDMLQWEMPLKGSFTALGWNTENLNGHKAYGHSGGPGLGDILRFPEQKLTIIVFTNDADLYPYLAASIAKFYFPDIKPYEDKKTMDRGFDKLY